MVGFSTNSQVKVVIMTRKTPILIDQDTDNVEVIDFFTEGADLTQTDEQAKVAALVDALRDGGESFLQIHKLTLGGQNMPEQFCERIPADKFDIGQLSQHISKIFGAGDYRIRLYVKGKIRANKLISVAQAIKADEKSSASSDAAGILDTVLKRMEAQNNQIMMLMSQKNEPQQSRKEMLEEMLMYKQLFGGQNQPTPQVDFMSQMTQTISFLKEMGVNIGGATIDGEKEEGFGDLIEKMSPLIGAAITAGQTQPAPAPKIDPQIVRQKQMNMMQKIAIKSRISVFIKAAAKNSDQSVYAEMLIDQLGEDTAKSYAVNPDIVGELIKIEPAIATHKEWFELLLEHVKAMLYLPSSVSDLYSEPESDINEATSVSPSGNHDD